ncbi:MAG: NAD-dependent DNA ligase LigA [Bacteroidales bacterium]|nr:NAD-dependent DNA ligase LigA [Bacteroidales bacterium]
MDAIEKQIRELRDQINAHNHKYYVLNQPDISDYDFDQLLKQLEKLEQEHPEYDDPLSPTHRVGSDLTKEFEQIEHLHPMLSLSNTYSVEEVDQWVERTERALAGQESDLVGEMKFDGTSISLIYEHGRLVRAVTRGDGERGDVVTDNIKTIRSIPLQLAPGDWPEIFELRGEVLLPWKEFERLNAERAFNEEPLFANPRNAAAGTLKLQDPKIVAQRHLDAYFYYLLGENLPSATHYGNMEAVKRWGFKVPDQMKILHDMKEVDEYIKYWDTARRELPVATDGLVFKVNSLQQQLNLGYTAKSPRWAIAYKFQAERACTELKFVSFDVGRMGIITPVANLVPVLLSGTMVKRASMHNQDIMQDQLDIHEHDMLYVEKGGEIIPKIVGVDLEARKPDAKKVIFVTHCPACGSPLVRKDGEAAWICPNKYGCPPQITGRVEHFVGRRMMNIDGIGEEISNALFEAGFVHNIADLYTLTREQLLTLEGFGEKSADRLLKGIQDSLKVPFERVLYALSIPYVGETTAKKIARSCRSIDRLMNMTEEELCAIEDVGGVLARCIIEYFASPINREIIERLRKAGVQLAMEEEDESLKSDKLAGKVIVISGVFAKHSRDEYKKMIELNGGKNSGSISKKTTFVLAGENMGPAKLEKAQALGVPIINEDQFLELLQ